MGDHYNRPSLSRGSSDSRSESGSFAASTVAVSEAASSQSGRTLLFGEISSSDGKSNCSTSSVCNLVLSNNPTFLRFWLTENCRNALLKNIDRQTLPAMRQVCHNFASSAAPFLFKEITIKFKANTFSKASGRLKSLRRIGKHVNKLKFKVPHSAEAFLPPLLDPFTGQMITFQYEPQPEHEGNIRRPRYGSNEMTDMLIRQYPPVFHAATNIPSFVRAFSYLPRLEHVTVVSPDQNMTSRYRRSVADYVLISIRMALERAPLSELHSLKLEGLHPAALLHLLPVMSFGSSPNSCKRWTQVRKLEITMDSTPFGLCRAEEHLRVVHAYLRAFSSTLTNLSFGWTGLSKGPSPLSPEGEFPALQTPVLVSPSSSFGEMNIDPYPQPLFHQYPAHQPSKPLYFPLLQTLSISRATAHATHLGSFVTCHRATLQTADFEDVTLRSGTWKSALVDPLKRIKRAELAELQARHDFAEKQQFEQQQLLQIQANRPGTRVTVYDETGEAMAMDVPVCMLIDGSDENIARGGAGLDEEDLIIEGELEPQTPKQNGFLGGLKRMLGLREKGWEPPLRMGIGDGQQGLIGRKKAGFWKRW